MNNEDRPTDLAWFRTPLLGLAVRQVVQLVVRLAPCRTTCCGLAVGFLFVVDMSYSLLYSKLYD